MKIFIGFESALKYLLSNGLQRERTVYGSRYRKLEPTRAKPQPGNSLKAKEIKSLGYPDVLEDGELDICVAHANDRPKDPAIHAHVWHGPDRGTYLIVDDSYLVASPEAVFLQLANKLSTAHLIELGYMLCGTYIPQSIQSAQHSDVLPLTSVNKLNRYAKKCNGVYGITHAREALRWVADGSASIMETRLVMLLCLSPKLGGYGLPMPSLNKEIILPQKLATRTSSNIRKPDLYWASGKVALEYDSKRYHAGEVRVTQDRQRANELESADIKIFSAGPKDLYDMLALDGLATQIAKAIGFRLRIRRTEYLERRFNLHNQLLGTKEWELLKREPEDYPRQF